jgi:hypothetical protein
MAHPNDPHATQYPAPPAHDPRAAEKAAEIERKRAAAHAKLVADRHEEDRKLAEKRHAEDAKTHDNDARAKLTTARHVEDAKIADKRAKEDAKLAAGTMSVGPDQHVLTTAEQETCDALYEELKPQATAAARDYVLNRTPVLYQEAMTAKIDADWPVPPA